MRQHFDATGSLDDFAGTSIDDGCLEDSAEQRVQKCARRAQQRQKDKHFRQRHDHRPSAAGELAEIEEETAIGRNDSRPSDASDQARKRNTTIGTGRDGPQRRDQDRSRLGQNPQLTRQRIGRDGRVVRHDAHQQ